MLLEFIKAFSTNERLNDFYFFLKIKRWREMGTIFRDRERERDDFLTSFRKASGRINFGKCTNNVLNMEGIMSSFPHYFNLII